MERDPFNLILQCGGPTSVMLMLAALKMARERIEDGGASIDAWDDWEIILDEATEACITRCKDAVKG